MATSIQDKFHYLFEPALLEELVQLSRVKGVPAEMKLISVGEPISAMPLILSGSVKVMSEDEQGNELLLYYLESGDTCAMTIQCCGGNQKSKIHAVTEEPSMIAFIPAKKMEDWMVKYKSWRTFVLDSYNVRLSEMLEAIDNLAFHNMEERLYKYLRDKAMVVGSAELKTTHAQIANDLNSSRVVVSRLMKKLEIEGKVKSHRNRIEVSEFLA